MATTSTNAPGHTLTLSEEERTELLGVLEQAVREKRIEVHRTDALTYKEQVEREATVLEGLLRKVRQG
jgi:hypothetical protein